MESSRNNQSFIKSRSQIESSWTELNESRKNDKFGDLTIILPDGSEFNVHKFVLSEGCRYFKARFEYEALSQSENSSVSIINLERQVSSEIFGKIIDFIYTGDIEITFSNALIFHENAVYFNLPHLKEIAARVLTKCIPFDISLQHWRDSVSQEDGLEKYYLDVITESCEMFLDRFILDLTFEELKKIISSNKIDFRDVKLYEFVNAWAKADTEELSEHLKLLLVYLRCIGIKKCSRRLEDLRKNKEAPKSIPLHSLR